MSDSKQKVHIYLSKRVLNAAKKEAERYDLSLSAYVEKRITAHKDQSHIIMEIKRLLK